MDHGVVGGIDLDWTAAMLHLKLIVAVDGV